MLDANLQRYTAADLKQLLADLRVFDIQMQNDHGAFLERYVRLVLATCGEQGNSYLEEQLPDQGEALFGLFEQMLDLIEEMLIVHVNYRHGAAFIASKGKSFGVAIRPNLVLTQEQMRKELANLVEQIDERDVVKVAVLNRCSGLLFEEQAEKAESYRHLVDALEHIEADYEDHPWARCLSGVAHLCLPDDREAGVESLFQSLLCLRECGSRLDRALLCNTVSGYCLL